MDSEFQEQEEVAAKWQAAIDSIEAAGPSVADGVLTAPPIDGLDPSLDPDIVAALEDSIQAVNQQVPDGKREEPTVPTTHRHTVLVTLCGLALLAVSGCGGGTSAPTTASTPPPSSAASQTYSSKAFVVPFTVTVDAALKSPPIRDSSHFLTWDAVASQENKVRFMVPVEVFRAGKETPQAPPKEYLKYLMAQAKDGAVFSNVTKITVDGRPATLMDTTTYDPEGFLSGLLGCFERVSNKHGDGCAGLQPDATGRLAVIDVGDTTLLAWARSQGVVDREFFATFERMLQSVRFR
jgi:hypothetical protein